MKQLKSIALALSAVALGFAAMPAHAQKAGSILWRAGAITITPSVSSGNLTQAPQGTEATVNSATSFGGGITYMLSDNIAVDVPLALPFEHEISGAGSFLNGVGKLATTKVLPITATVQYRFGAADAQFRPYVGAGFSYAMFYDERSTLALTASTGGTPANPTTVTFKDKLAAAVQAGVSFQINKAWHADLSATYSPLKTTGTLSTKQTLDMTLNPTAINIGVGMKF
jgi:outer membrane protein